MKRRGKKRNPIVFEKRKSTLLKNNKISLLIRQNIIIVITLENTESEWVFLDLNSLKNLDDSSIFFRILQELQMHLKCLKFWYCDENRYLMYRYVYVELANLDISIWSSGNILRKRSCIVEDHVTKRDNFVLYMRLKTKYPFFFKYVFFRKFIIKVGVIIDSV